MGRYDMQVGSSDHMFASFWHQRAPAKFDVDAATGDRQRAPIRIRRTRGSAGSTTIEIFTQTLLNHMSMGYLNRNEGYGSVNQEFVDDFPQIAGVAGYNVAADDQLQ